MADIEQRLRDLEETLSQTESMIHKEKANMPEGDDLPKEAQMEINYMYVAGGAVPIVTALVLYFMQPKIVTKDGKGKKLDYTRFAMWVAIVTIVAWGGLFALQYFNVFNN